MNIAVVSDSTAVAEAFKEQYSNFFSVPLRIIFKDDSYADGIDLTQDSFFELLGQSPDLPTTSQPSIGEVEIIFTELLKTYDHIIYLTLSSKISGTYDSGMMARHIVSEERVTVVDTLHASIIHKIMTKEALQMIEAEHTLKEIIVRLELFRDHSRVILVVDDLKHLSRTGRISATSASIGSMLQIKPILHFTDGKIELLKKIRSVKKAHQALIEMVREADLKAGDHIMIAQAQGQDYAEKVKNELEKVCPDINIGIDALSPVISVHTGPKTVGVGWIKL